MDTYFLGSIIPWAVNYAPVNWHLCDGSLLPIQNNAALFSLLGTNFGGDGQRSFGLPDLRGRTPLGVGQGPGLSDVTLGQPLGAEGTALTEQNMPTHTHTLAASNTARPGVAQNPTQGWTPGAADNNAGGGRVPVINPVQMYSGAAQPNPVASAPSSVAGANTPVPTAPPAACTNFIICINGLYPQFS